MAVERRGRPGATRPSPAPPVRSRGLPRKDQLDRRQCDEAGHDRQRQRLLLERGGTGNDELADAIARQERLLVVADYDADGRPSEGVAFVSTRQASLLAFSLVCLAVPGSAILSP